MMRKNKKNSHTRAGSGAAKKTLTRATSGYARKLRYAPLAALCTLALLLLTAPFAFADGNDNQAPVVVEWFDSGTAGYIGGTIGASVGSWGGWIGGLLGTVLGCFGWFLAVSKYGQRLLVSLCRIGFLITITLTVAPLLVGLIAVCLGQPYHVWALFIILGISFGIFCAIFFFIFWFASYGIRKAYALIETHRMESIDRSGLDSPPPAKFPKKEFIVCTLLCVFFVVGIFCVKPIVVNYIQNVQAPAEPWFSGATAGLIGGVLGCTIGLWGALLGGYGGGYLIPRGKGRRLITGIFLFSITLGVTLLAVGLAAMYYGQPYHVWYVFTLPGMLLTILSSIFVLMLPYMYAQSELRKMQAIDV